MDVTKLKNSLYLLGFILFITSCLGYASTPNSGQTYSSKTRVELLSPSTTGCLSDSDWLSHYFDENTVTDAINFIATADNHGLNPADYQLDKLQQLLASTTDKTQFYRLLSSRLALLIHDLKNGRYDPAIVDPDWHISKNDFDAQKLLIQALESKDLKSHLQRVAPQSDEYKQLTETLKTFRVFAEQNNWPHIPAIPMLRPADTHPAIVIIQSRLAAEDKLMALSHSVQSDFYDALMEQAVKRFQTRYGLKVDGIIGPQTREELNITAQQRVQQIKVNLERYRWLPDDFGDRYIYINVANFKLKAYENGQEKLDMKVIVGRKSRQTPSFSGELGNMVFNPYWTVPKKLARLDLLPKQQQNPHYFIDHDIKVFSINNGQRTELDPSTINWQAYSNRQTLPYTLRQEPGHHNALGKIKFLFQNPWSIYLHDTPHKSLFNKENRAISSGCIRVEDPIGLANFTLNKPEKQHLIIQNIDSKQNRGLKLSQPVGIFAAYFTVSTDDDQVIFSPDIYQRDKRMIKLLY